MEDNNHNEKEETSSSQGQWISARNVFIYYVSLRLMDELLAKREDFQRMVTLIEDGMFLSAAEVLVKTSISLTDTLIALPKLNEITNAFFY